MGRPTKMTKDALSKLSEAFVWGCTDVEACSNAGISPSALYRYQEKNPEFRERKEVLKSNHAMRARRVISDALDESDLATAHKVIERKEGKKLTVQGGDRPLTIDLPWVVNPIVAQTSDR